VLLPSVTNIFSKEKRKPPLLGVPSHFSSDSTRKPKNKKKYDDDDISYVYNKTVQTTIDQMIEEL
jgi:hypothetical protein